MTEPLARLASLFAVAAAPLETLGEGDAREKVRRFLTRRGPPWLDERPCALSSGSG